MRRITQRDAARLWFEQAAESNGKKRAEYRRWSWYALFLWAEGR